MTREQTLLLSATQLLVAKWHAGYGPAHAVADALELEAQVLQQSAATTFPRGAFDGIAPEHARSAGAA